MLRGVGYARTEDMVIRYLGFEIGLRGMVPESIFKSYLGGIKSYFVENKVRNYFSAVTGSEYLRFIRRGYRKIHAITHPEGEAKKIAFTMEMCNHVGPALDRLGLYRDPLKRGGGNLVSHKFGDLLFIAKIGVLANKQEQERQEVEIRQIH